MFRCSAPLSRTTSIRSARADRWWLGRSRAQKGVSGQRKQTLSPSAAVPAGVASERRCPSTYTMPPPSSRADSANFGTFRQGSVVGRLWKKWRTVDSGADGPCVAVRHVQRTAEDAWTIAAMPARTAGGSAGHAATTAARSGGSGGSAPGAAPGAAGAGRMSRKSTFSRWLGDSPG